MNRPVISCGALWWLDASLAWFAESSRTGEASIPVLRRFARRQPSFEPKNSVFQLQHPFFALQFFALTEVFERVGDLVQSTLDLVHHLAQLLNLPAQLHHVAPKEQRALEQFKELLPHGG